MRFDELDQQMRVFETISDTYVLPEIYMVARIDGRGFTRLTKEVQSFDLPFDERFRDAMVRTTEHLMRTGFRVLYGYTQSDEISLLVHREESAYNRKLRKYNSILAGEASAKFSLLLGFLASFDCRISQLPSMERVADYFRWRSEDAHRNALNSHCYWLLRKQGLTATQATAKLHKMTVADKNELLFQAGINFNHLPTWQKRGVGLYWETYVKKGVNPITEREESAVRQRIKIDYDLPMKEDYSQFILGILRNSDLEDSNKDT